MVKPWQVVLATVGIFAAGLVAGGAVALGMVHLVSERRQAGQEAAAPAGSVAGTGSTGTEAATAAAPASLPTAAAPGPMPTVGGPAPMATTEVPAPIAAAPVTVAPPVTEPQFGPQLIRTYVDGLNLTPAQRARINPIVRRTSDELSRIRRENQLSSALTIEHMQDEISAVLTIPQRTQFNELLRVKRRRLEDIIDQRRRRQMEQRRSDYSRPR